MSPMVEEVLEIAKKVVARAAKARMSLTPEAYAVWYAYFEGKNNELTAEIDAIEASGRAFSEAVNAELYKRYFAAQGEARVMEEVQKETQNLLSGVFNDLLSANQNTSEYGGRLNEYVEKLKQVKSIADIQLIMRGLLSDTNKMAAASKELETNLKEATQQAERLRTQLKQTKEEAMRDALTGLHNRKSFDVRINDLLQEFKRDRIYFSAIFVDIDFFKRFNDTYGHKVGDLVLQTVAGILHRGVKGSDFPARYGGEEFVILLPATTIENAVIVAEHLRVQISVKKPRNPETEETYDKITASFGVSQVREGDTVASMLERADKSLYLAKDSGRNNVKTERDLS
ncbi:MAG: GGDEF domain-containing protein [Thermodesulfobacteriota bacterium]